MPDIVIGTPSTASMEGESSTVNPKFSSEKHHQKINNYVAIKLNRFKNEERRFKSHIKFVSHCITNDLVAKGLQPRSEIMTKIF